MSGAVETLTPSDSVRRLGRDRLISLGANRLASLLLEHSLHDQKLMNVLQQIAANPQRYSRADDSDEPCIVGSSPAMRTVFTLIRKFAATDALVLIRGESGTGKELVACAIHERSACADGPFVSVNCAALPEHLIASELFGHEKGAFTGAHQQRIGSVEAAQNGTLFLDEIGDLPIALQGHLLRFLQEKVIQRIGSTTPLRVTVRVIAATNIDLERAVRNGTFRQDLYYRLNELSLKLPALREREGDIPLLLEHFLKKFARKFSANVHGFDDEAWRFLCQYSWPGNVRELISVVRRSVIMASGDLVRLSDVGIEDMTGIHEQKAENPTSPAAVGSLRLDNVRQKAEQEAIRAALAACNGRVSAAADRLGISRVTLYRLIEKHGLECEIGSRNQRGRS